MNRRSFLRCLPAAPIAVAATPAAALMEGHVEPDGDEREVLEVCESCERPLFEGDLAFSYSDGPTFCADHAPTWNDLKAEQDELIASGIFEECYEDAEHAAAARQLVLSRIEEGHGNDKYVWGL